MYPRHVLNDRRELDVFIGRFDSCGGPCDKAAEHEEIPYSLPVVLGPEAAGSLDDGTRRYLQFTYRDGALYVEERVLVNHPKSGRRIFLSSD